MGNRKNYKILSSLFISSVIAGMSLLLIFNFFPSTTFQETKENSFFNKEFETNEQKIFIFGASNTGRINSTLVDDIISKNHENYSVYNLSYDGDLPNERYKLLPQILSLDPSIIFYSISYRSFQNIELEQSSDSLLKYLDRLTDNKYELDSLNPRLATLTAIKQLTFGKSLSSENRIVLPNSPLITMTSQATKIVPLTDLEKPATFTTPQIDIVNNEQVDYFKRILTEIKKNDIKIVIFTAPLSKPYLDVISVSDKQNFKQIINEISNEFNVPVYNFSTSYASLDVWADFDHVAFNKNSVIYSIDITNMILMEIDS